jgi:hypothetical protein
MVDQRDMLSVLRFCSKTEQNFEFFHSLWNHERYSSRKEEGKATSRVCAGVEREKG